MVFGLGTRRIENEMAEWLAHPNEFGVRPKRVQLKRTYRVNVITYGDVKLHLVEYEMPDGTAGRGFVNGSLTWSFLGDGSTQSATMTCWSHIAAGRGCSRRSGPAAW